MQKRNVTYAKKKCINNIYLIQMYYWNMKNNKTYGWGKTNSGNSPWALSLAPYGLLTITRCSHWCPQTSPGWSWLFPEWPGPCMTTQSKKDFFLALVFNLPVQLRVNGSIPLKLSTTCNHEIYRFDLLSNYTVLLKAT